MEARLYMVIECFRNGDPQPVYARFRERGRLAPAGLEYVSSWVSEDLKTCYQVMSTSDEKLLHEWMQNWHDLVEFEVQPVMTSSQASEAVRASENKKPAN
jgi:hypothetical protein